LFVPLPYALASPFNASEPSLAEALPREDLAEPLLLVKPAPWRSSALSALPGALGLSRQLARTRSLVASSVCAPRTKLLLYVRMKNSEKSPAQVLSAREQNRGPHRTAQNSGAKSGAAQNYGLRIENDVLPPAQAPECPRPECPRAPGSNMRSRQCARAAPAQNYGLHMKKCCVVTCPFARVPGSKYLPHKSVRPPYRTMVCA
jgi:hypothetical protein